MADPVMVEPDGSIRLPAALLAELGFKEGDELTFESVDGRILIRRRSDAVTRSPV